MRAKRDAKAAMGRGDLKTLVGIFDVWPEDRPAPAGYDRAYVEALITLERCEDALAVLVDPRHGFEPDYAYFHALALAQAGMGRLGYALGSAVKAVQALPAFDLTWRFEHIRGELDHAPSALDRAMMWPEYSAAIERQLAKGKRANAMALLKRFLAERAEALQDALARGATAQAGGRPPATWGDAQRLACDYQRLGRPGEAAAVLVAALASGMTLSPGERADLFALPATLAPRLAPEALAALAEALEPACKGKAERLAMRQVRRRLAGKTPPSDPDAPDPGRLRNDARAFLGLACAAIEQWDAAIAILGPLADRARPGAPYLAELAFCTGQDILGGFRSEPRPRAERRVFDLFPFHGEQRALEIKLNEMGDWIDRFVIVEARHSRANQPKPLMFETIRDRFDRWAPKLRYLTIDAFPEHATTPIARDLHLRDQAIFGLGEDFAPDDLVLLTDPDEVVDRRALEGFSGDFASLGLRAYRYFLNYHRTSQTESRLGDPSVWRAAHLRHQGVSHARLALAPWSAADRIVDAGWRFALLEDAPGAGVEGVIKDEAAFAARRDRLRRGELEPGWERCEIDARFPAHVRSGAGPLKALIL